MVFWDPSSDSSSEHHLPCLAAFCSSLLACRPVSGGLLLLTELLLNFPLREILYSAAYSWLLIITSQAKTEPRNEPRSSVRAKLFMGSSCHKHLFCYLMKMLTGVLMCHGAQEASSVSLLWIRLWGLEGMGRPLFSADLTQMVCYDFWRTPSLSLTL